MCRDDDDDDDGDDALGTIGEKSGWKVKVYSIERAREIDS